jgi:SAM-dependent methyltransferase
LSARPFYSEYAWAFDLLIDRPVRKECAAIVSWFIERGVRPGATVLDAGCGTGRYAGEMARRGYVVHAVDASRELVDQAMRSVVDRPASLSFGVGDITVLPPAGYDGILCRGVLNDFVEDDKRVAAFAAFARALRADGVLIFDVREWESSAERKLHEPLFRKRVSTERGTLTFTSVTRVDRDNRCLMISERHTLTSDDGERSSDYEFTMRCWTRPELQGVLAQSGFDRVAMFGAYDPAIEAGRTDRLVVVSQRRNPSV